MSKYLFFLPLFFLVTTSTAEEYPAFDNQEYLDRRLEIDLDGKNFTLLVKSIGFEELEMWGDYKNYKADLLIQESFEERLEGNICIIIAMEPPYSKMPIYPKEFLVSLIKKDDGLECYRNDSINIYPATERYLGKVKASQSKNTK